MPKPLRTVGKMWYDAPCTHGASAGRGVWKYDAGSGTGGAGLAPGPSALRFSGRGDAVDQPDLRPRRDLDPAGGGAAASAEAPLDRDVPVLCADSGSDLLQYRSETPGRPGPALLGEYRGGAADSTPGGRILSLGAHGAPCGSLPWYWRLGSPSPGCTCTSTGPPTCWGAFWWAPPQAGQARGWQTPSAAGGSGWAAGHSGKNGPDGLPSGPCGFTRRSPWPEDISSQRRCPPPLPRPVASPPRRCG